MCLICGQESLFKLVGNYRVCRTCGTWTVIDQALCAVKGQASLEDQATRCILANKVAMSEKIDESKYYMLNKMLNKSKRLLDFGCGKGSFVKLLISNGYKAFAYDKSKEITKFLDKEHIPHFKNTRVIPFHYFDIITCFDVIEHNINPKSILQIVKQKLKKKGVFIISTPNSCGISARILGGKWWVFGPSFHFILFSPCGFEALLQKEGFTSIEIITDTITPWVVPMNSLFAKIINKIIYLLLTPFKSIFFKTNNGDNIIAVAIFEG